MQFTIPGKKNKDDVTLTDDRLICAGKEYLYAEMTRIWVQIFLGASIDCTWRKRHHAFRIDKGAVASAEEAVAAVQKILDANALQRIASASQLRTSQEFYDFSRENGLMEPMIPAGWFCDRMEAIFRMLAEGERILLPFEALCGLTVVMSENAETVSALQTGQAQFVCAVTDRRVILHTHGSRGSLERSIPLEQIRSLKTFQNGMLYRLLIVTEDRELRTAILSLGDTEEKMIRKTLEMNIPGLEG